MNRYFIDMMKKPLEKDSNARKLTLIYSSDLFEFLGRKSTLVSMLPTRR